ncbi:MAG: toll/interleukin-1 receptor domain-containing protein [Hyphomonadaceae bacterium JAD_PAG50586_4]|nr:MAG: toll/interleukin-1 receptor domain-containing protein [Hyphomonadaceae bacterium JAD_PAG50586_4]
MQEFFDASDLQPGEDWDAEIRSKAATSALLAIRTDLYPSREWCQREMLIAKQTGMPIVIMDALGHAEERGSFLMDHVPRVPIRLQGDTWAKGDIYHALDLLVDECLKRALWIHQERLSRGRSELQIAWWAPHAPEPVTLVQWLQRATEEGSLTTETRIVRILHPDPPLGRDEKLVLDQVLSLTGISAELDIMTPRLLAARGG